MQRSRVFSGKSCLRYGIVLILTLVLSSAPARPTEIDPLPLVTASTYATGFFMNGTDSCCRPKMITHNPKVWDKPGTYIDLTFYQHGFSDCRIKFTGGKWPRVDYFQDAVVTGLGFTVTGLLTYSFIVYRKGYKRSVVKDQTVPVNITAAAEILISKDKDEGVFYEHTVGSVTLYQKDAYQTIVSIDKNKTFHKRTTKIWAKPYIEEYSLELHFSTQQIADYQVTDECRPEICKGVLSRKMRIYVDPVIEIDPTAYVTVDGKPVLATEVFDVALSGNLFLGDTTGALKLLLGD